MTRSVNLLSLAAVQDAQRREFYQKMFPGRHRDLSEHWRWWYRSGEFSGIEPIAALRDGRMVGQAGVIPEKLEMGGVVTTAIWFIDFAVVPECQGLGLGKQLTRAWMALCPNQITFCNDRSMRIFRKFGWHESFQSHRCAAPIHPLRVLEARVPRLGLPRAVRDSARLARASSLWLRGRLRHAPVLAPEALDPSRLWDLMKAGGPRPAADLAVHRDEQWVDWRFARNPFLREHLLFRHAGAFGVARAFLSSGLRRFHILYVDGPEGADIALYHAMTRWAFDRGMDLVWMNTNEPALLPRLKGFLPSQAPIRFASFSEDTELRERLKSGIRGLQAVDGDNDLLNPSDGPTTA